MRQKTVVVSARGVGAQLETLPERWVPFHEGQREAGVIEGIGIQDVGLWCAHHLPLIDGAGLVPVTIDRIVDPGGLGDPPLERKVRAAALVPLLLHLVLLQHGHFALVFGGPLHPRLVLVRGPAVLHGRPGDQRLPQAGAGHADHVIVVLVVHRPKVGVESADGVHSVCQNREAAPGRRQHAQIPMRRVQDHFIALAPLHKLDLVLNS
mmetsp:Transcript_70137/g.116972  ORF Transcript_70137/g.116972 Transcript_70137/m.116972 type:complete len:208 (+) Transcript_70137:628-1251(+)